MKGIVRQTVGLVPLAALLFLATCGMAQVNKKADALFNKAEYVKALQQYKKTLSTQKLNVATQSEIYSKIAKCYKELGYYRPARDWFEKVIQLNPDNMDNYIMLAEMQRCNGSYMDALSYYYRYSAAMTDTAKLEKKRAMLLYPVGNNYVNPFVNINGQYAINTFGKKRGLLFFGGKLYYSTTGHLLDPLSPDYNDHIYDYHVFKSDVADYTLTNSLPETDIPIFVRNKVLSFAVCPGTNDIYFVSLNKKGDPTLYISQFSDSVYSRKKAVKIGGKSLPVEHLAFTADGRKMIFSAYLEGKGQGNNDLWVSELSGADWQEPKNLGDKINTNGDEITPFVSGNTLFFSSNGQAENYGGFDIYCVSLDPPMADVYNLKMPYNSFADDFSLVLSADGKGGFLVSTRDTTMLDDKIYSFSETPNYTMRKGAACDSNGRYLDGVNITIVDAVSDKVLYMTKSGKNGKFAFFLDNAKNYRLDLERENYFPLRIEANSLKQNSGDVCNPTKKENIILDGFEMNRPYKMSGIFHQTADVEVQNTLFLSSITTFLKDNPSLTLYVHLFGYLSSEEDFNEILNQKRIGSLLKFFEEQGVSSSRVRYETYENMQPVNFPDIDEKTDNTYLLYFVVCPQKTRPLLPKNKEFVRQE
ncbi:MAG: PD40 domain-containing protein [Bacteroidales bacterium]|nr:PD40 domain-containing protein [Bacteroidales bacterium]